MALTVSTPGTNAAPSLRIGEFVWRKGQYQPTIGSYNMDIMFVVRG